MSTTKVKLSVAARGLGEALRGVVAHVSVIAISGSEPARTVIDSKVIFSEMGKVLVAGTLEDFLIELAPTDGSFCYRWRIETDLGRPLTVYTSVPASVEPVNFGDLHQVDPKTFAPTAEVIQAWTAVLVEVSLHLEEIREVNANVAAKAEEIHTDALLAKSSATSADLDAKATRLSHLSVIELTEQTQDAAADVAGAVTVVQGVRDDVNSTWTNIDALRLSVEATARGVGDDADDVREDVATLGAIRDDVAAKSASVSTNKRLVDSAKSAVDTAAAQVDQDKTDVRVMRDNFSVALDSAGVELGQVRLDVLASETRIGQTVADVDSVKMEVDQTKTDTLEAKRLAEVARDSAVTTKGEVDQLKTDTAQFKSDAEKARDLSLTGQFLGVIVPPNANLDTYKTPGSYRVPDATGITGLPFVGFLGNILILSRDNNVRQTQIAFWQAGTTNSDARNIYIRANNGDGTSWNAWRAVPTQRTNSPAGQPGTEVFTWNDALRAELGVFPVGIDMSGYDLNLLVLPGVYNLQLAANATLARNYPRANAGGILEVLRLGTANGGRIMQRFTVQNGDASAKMAGIYQRRIWDGVWDPWEFIPAQRVDETVGRRVQTFDNLNNRWQMIAGDTGWRDITALMTAGWTGSLRIRRTMYHVALRGSIVRNDSTTAEFLPYIAGFKGYSTDDYGVAMQSSAARLVTGGSTGISITASTTGSSTHRIIVDFETLDAWPTALPGSALGAIPFN